MNPLNAVSCKCVHFPVQCWLFSFPRSTKLSRAWTFQFRIFINVRFQLESHEKLSAVFGWRSKVRTFLTWHIESRLLVRKITGTDGCDVLILFNKLNHTYSCRSMFIKTNRIGNCCVCVCVAEKPMASCMCLCTKRLTFMHKGHYWKSVVNDVRFAIFCVLQGTTYWPRFWIEKWKIEYIMKL